MKCEGSKTYDKPGSCPVCKMDLVQVNKNNDENYIGDDEISETSIFNLTSKWNTQNGNTIELKELKGQVLVVVMIYTSCQAACPRLVSDVRRIYEEVSDKNIRYVFVSIDPETDTPQRLKQFSFEHEMDGPQWTFLQGTPDDVREFANVLAMKYKKISPMNFSHSNIISVFDADGVLQYQREGLGVSNKEIIAKILDLTS